MKSKHAGSNASAPGDLSAQGLSTDKVLLDDSATEPGTLEEEHSRLMEMQGKKTEEQLLVKLACEFVAQAQTLGLRLEKGKDRKHWQGILDYWSIFVYRVMQLDIEATLLPFDPKLAPTLADEQYPYSYPQGCAPEAQHMLGMRRLLDECERDLARDHLLTIAGDTGSGRRSFIHQFLIPILQAGRARHPDLQGSEEWRYCTISLGEAPVEDMLCAFRDRAEREGKWVARQVDVIRRDPTKLAAIAESGFEAKTFIAIDNFESLLKSPEQERDLVVRALSSLLNDLQRRYVLALTLRRGQTRELAKFGPLEQILRQDHVLLAFTTAELRHLIEEPAKRIGLVFDAGVIDQILINIQGEPRALPLLQFTLWRLWRLRTHNRITREALEMCGAGANAIVKAVDAVYQDLDEKQRSVFQSVLLEMVNLEPTGQFEPISVSESDLVNVCGDWEELQVIIARLRDENLIYELRVGSRQEYALTNWTVLTAWPPMVAWLDELQLKHRFRLRFKEAADSWEKGHRSEDLLWRGVRLAEADREFTADASLTSPERNFLDAGRFREAKITRRRYAISGLLIASAFLVIVAFVSMRSHIVKQQQRLTNATDALVDGDFPKALLWLQTRVSSAFLLEDTRLDQRMAELMRLQLPELTLRRVVKQDSDNFDDMSVSPDGLHVATIRTDVTSKTFWLDISKVDNIGTVNHPIPQPFKQGTDSAIGHVIFASVGSDIYLIAAMGELYCWKVDSTSPKNWKSVDLHLPVPRENASIDAFASNSGLLSITWREGEASSLDLFELRSSTEGLQLQLLPPPEGLSETEVRLASLSSQGSLVVVSGEESARARTLTAWVRSGSRPPDSANRQEWTSAKPPNWAFELQAARSSRLVDGGWVPSAGKDNQDQAWQCVDSDINAVSFSPRGNEFATASNDGQVLVWSIKSLPNGDIAVYPRIETELRLGSSIFDVAILNDEILATGGRDRTTRFWNFQSRIEVAPRNFHEATVSKLHFVKPDRLITRTKEIVRSWKSPEYVELDVPSVAGQIAVSTDSHQVFVSNLPSTEEATFAANLDGSLTNARNLEAAILNKEWGALNEVSPNGEWVLCTSEVAIRDQENAGNVRPLETSLLLRRSTAPERPKHLLGLAGLKSVPKAVFSPGDKCHWLLIAEPKGVHEPPRLRCWNLAKVLSEEETAEGKEIKLPDSDRTFTDQENVEKRNGEHRGNDFSLSKLTINRLALNRCRGRDLLVIVGKQMTDERNKGIVFIGLADPMAESPWILKRLGINKSPESPEGFPHEEEVLCVGISPNGDYLATGDAHDVVKIWSTEELLNKFAISADITINCQPVSKFEHSSNVELLEFSPSGAELLTVSSEGEATLWPMTKLTPKANLNTKVNPKPLHKLLHPAHILSASFSPDGKWIITGTGGLDSSARVWDRSSARLMGIFRHTKPLMKVWMPDESRILTASRSSHDTSSQLRFWTTAKVPQADLLSLERIAARKVAPGELKIENLNAADF